MTHADIETKIEDIVLLAIHLPPPEALRVCRRLRDAADDILHQIIAAAQMPAPPAPAKVVPIRPDTTTRYVSVPKAAMMLGMSSKVLYTKLEDPPYKAMLFDNGTRKRQFIREKLEAHLGNGQAHA